MRALQMIRPGEMGLTDLPLPVPGPRDVLVRTLAATICTSDLHDLERNPFHIPLPRVLGHEAAGVIAAAGPEVGALAVGTRVAAHPVVPCGHCAECGRGWGHLCSNLGHLGHDRDGAFAEFFVQRADRVRALPASVPAPVGALLEPVAVCLQAIARAGTIRGRDVLIAGDGPFGNIIARLAARAGAHRVIVAGREPFRLGLIRGAETTTVPPKAGVDVAILAVSSAEAAISCLQALRPRGRLVIFSALPQAPTLDLFGLHLRELEIVGACNDEERLDEALQQLSDPELALSEIVTHQLPLDRWREAFGLARQGHDRALKVAFTFGDAT